MKIGDVISLVCVAVALTIGAVRLAGVGLNPAPAPSPDAPEFEPTFDEKAATAAIRQAAATMDPKKAARIAAVYDRLAEYIAAGELDSTGQLREFQRLVGGRVFSGYGSTPGLSDGGGQLGAVSNALVEIGNIPLDEKRQPKAVPLDDSRRPAVARACRAIAWAARNPLGG